MIPNPILKVLSSIQKNGVTCLLMGGQACVLYGGAEFSRDTDLAVLADAENLRRLQAAFDELAARRIAVPPFEPRFLEMGLVVHFRCHHRDGQGVRSIYYLFFGVSCCVFAFLSISQLRFDLLDRAAEFPRLAERQLHTPRQVADALRPFQI